MPIETFIVTVYCLVCEALNTVVRRESAQARVPAKIVGC
ncbi:MAG: hypothetical protein AW06_001827 [Candidatus Accumulibacter cognatus]|uniref:Uncharacterized protein n=1 Tax=Candidatus Accumulibacter cognatus TaxID=2954383 RepID=A0A080M771_9PROT|nr:MAG: hypothetical protein AW06_001827 [Candidatus Accumulibacter cognatus]